MRIPDTDVEFKHIPDTGCAFHPKCLECPRAICIYDEPATPKATPLRMKLPRVMELMANGMTHKQIGEELGITRNTVSKMLSRYNYGLIK